MSVGVAVAPDHGRDGAALLRSADVALSVAKRHRGTAVYRADRDPFDMRRLQLLAGLRDAILGGALNLEYQPKIDLATGRVAGVEALARWHHDELGDIAPGEFVPLAEDRGLIGALSEWVLDESGRQCQAWSGQGFAVDVSANISAQNLYDPGLVRWLQRLFDEGAVEPGQLTLELTESQIVADLPMAQQILRRLRALGAKLVDRRLRHRVLVALLPVEAAARRAEDRPVVRARPRPRGWTAAAGTGPRADDHRPRPRPRAAGRRRGRRVVVDHHRAAASSGATRSRASTCRGRSCPTRWRIWLRADAARATLAR